MQPKGEQQKLSLDHQLSLAKITEENGPRRDASHRLDAVDFSTELEPVRWTHGVIAKTPALAMIAAPNPRNLDRSWNARLESRFNIQCKAIRLEPHLRAHCDRPSPFSRARIPTREHLASLSVAQPAL